MAGSLTEKTRNNGETIRIDKLIWFLRFARNRSMARKLAIKGHIRLNGRRIDKAHCPVRAGDILTLPLRRDVQVIRISQLPRRRAGAAVAISCYEILETGK